MYMGKASDKKLNKTIAVGRDRMDILYQIWTKKNQSKLIFMHLLYLRNFEQ